MHRVYKQRVADVCQPAARLVAAAVRRPRSSRVCRIARPCVFCSKMQTNLHKHIAMKHKNNEAVKHALILPEREKTCTFNNFKKQGILEFNKWRIQHNASECLTERSRSDSSRSVMCSSCHGFYSKNV